MKIEENWKQITEEKSKVGTIIYYDTGNKKDYAMWNKENDCFMGWIRKYVVNNT